MPSRRLVLFTSPPASSARIAQAVCDGLLGAATNRFDDLRGDYGGVDPYNVIVSSNHPQHYSEDDGRAPGNQSTAFVSQRARIPAYHEAPMHNLAKAVSLYGQHPELFSRATMTNMHPSQCPPL